MLPFWRKKKPAQTDGERLVDALDEIAGSQKRRATRRRRSTLWRRYADPRLLLVPVALAVLLIADGVRRENMEFYATVTQATGPGIVRVAANEAPVALEAQQRIEDGGEVRTGPSCWATLDFPDGSVITLAPDSHLTVELLEYNRGGMWRGRSFSLWFGRMFARVSPGFGVASRCRVHTPASVASVRGTRFYVSHDAGRAETQIACNDGAVRVDGFRGRAGMLPGGAATSVSYGAEPERAKSMSQQERTSFARPPLYREIRPEPWLKRVELQITHALDLPLSVLGIGKSSWALLATDTARRTAAMKALQTIHTSIEGYRTYPDFVDPFTLRELDFRAEDAPRVLRNFDGDALEKYRRAGQGFVIYARARDRQRTPYRLTRYGVQRATEAEVAAL